nr:uncharacterized protein LOC117865220 [Setaria viridis]
MLCARAAKSPLLHYCGRRPSDVAPPPWPHRDFSSGRSQTPSAQPSLRRMPTEPPPTTTYSDATELRPGAAGGGIFGRFDFDSSTGAAAAMEEYPCRARRFHEAACLRKARRPQAAPLLFVVRAGSVPPQSVPRVGALREGRAVHERQRCCARHRLEDSGLHNPKDSGAEGR